MHVVSVNVGQPRPLRAAGRRLRSAIGKQPVTGPVAVHALGLAGDAQADTRLHGGSRKAVYAHAAEHYAHWRTAQREAGAMPWDDDGLALPFGAIGENLTIAGLAEDALWVGDLLRLPGCTLAVTEPRTPCLKFDAVMGFAAAPLMWRTGRCGSYLAVIEAGCVQAGDAVTLDPGPRQMPLLALFRRKAPRDIQALR